jgi:rhodanese-related sulfurtransferase
MSVAPQSSRDEPHGVVHALPGLVAESVLAAAREIAQEDGLRYAGDVTPQEAWALFSSGAAELVDVRTGKELQRVGRVPEARHVEWLTGTGMLKNPHFIDELDSLVGKDGVVLFLCRSGKRSVAAAEAATYAGFHHAFNVLEGFEGDGSPRQGWLNHDLPSVHD